MVRSNVLKVALKGEALLSNPRLNKGSCFTHEERIKFDLTGRLPYRVNTFEEQCKRAYDQFRSRDAPIHKNTFLQSLKAQNWVLYYGLLSGHLKEMIPIIYTPTEAEAISSYSHLFRRSEGLYLSFPEEDLMEKNYLDATKDRNIDLIVCTDAEQILGIGDQGVGGIGISTAKAAIYTLLGGIDPMRTLSVVLDVGTNNEELLNDDLYVGWRNKRLRGEKYDRFIDKFVSLVKARHPNCLLHFEDFGVNNAQRLLDLYREKHSVFNDDVQGTGAVTVAAILAALGVTKSKLSNQRIVCFGAGSAGLGISRQVRDVMMLLDGISKEEANSKFWLLDREGLLTQQLASEKKVRESALEFIRRDWDGSTSLVDVVKAVKPTILIGCSTKAVTPEDCLKWTDGKALLATGSPFPSVNVKGNDIDIAECNNALIYPGLGFGAILTRSRSLTPGMIVAGAQRLANMSPAHKDPTAAILPDFGNAPGVNFEVAIAVAEKAFDEGVAQVPWTKEQIREKAEEARWKPVYHKYVFDKNGEA